MIPHRNTSGGYAGGRNWDEMIFHLSEVTELQTVNMHGEKANGFFNICVYSLS